MIGAVLVLGATGNTGSAVVEALCDRPGVTVRTATRAVAGPTRCAHTRFDWADPGTFAPALDGVDSVYLVAPVGEADPARQVGPFLERARCEGVRRVVMLGSSAVDAGAQGLGEVVSAVRDTMPEWQILRPSWFMQNFTGSHPIAEAIRADGEFRTSAGTGRLPFIDARDIGRTAAHLLVAPRADNAEHRLTGPRALSYDEAAAVLADITGRPVRHRAVGTDEHIEFLTHAGYDAGFAAVLAGLDTRVRTTLEATVTDTVERLTGRAPRTFRDFVASATGVRR